MNGGYFLPTQVVADEDAQVAASSLVERRWNNGILMWVKQCRKPRIWEW